MRSIGLLSLFFAALAASTAFAQTLDTVKLFQRVTGTQPRSQDVAKLKGLDQKALFEKLFAEDDFVDNRIASFISRVANEEGEPFDDMDDYQAALLLAIVNDVNFTDIFQKPFSIVDTKGQKVSPSREQFRLRSRVDSLVDMPSVYRLSFESGGGSATYQDGLLSTFGFGYRNMRNSTNRRPVRASFDLFLCSKIESWKDVTLDPYYIGRDIDRKPGQKPHTFEGECRGCHAPMDAMRGAAAYYDFDANMYRLNRLAEVAPKYNRNNGTFTQGFQTTDASWENLLVSPVSQARFGWRGPTNGEGLLSFSTMISNSRQFQVCMTQRLVREFCDLSDQQASQKVLDPEFQRLANEFRESGYRVKTHIQKIVTSGLCK